MKTSVCVKSGSLRKKPVLGDSFEQFEMAQCLKEEQKQILSTAFLVIFRRGSQRYVSKSTAPWRARPKSGPVSICKTSLGLVCQVESWARSADIQVWLMRSIMSSRSTLIMLHCFHVCNKWTPKASVGEFSGDKCPSHRKFLIPSGDCRTPLLPRMQSGSVIHMNNWHKSGCLSHSLFLTDPHVVEALRTMATYAYWITYVVPPMPIAVDVFHQALPPKDICTTWFRTSQQELMDSRTSISYNELLVLRPRNKVLVREALYTSRCDVVSVSF